MMKLRLENNSVRLRLKKSELATLKEKVYIETNVLFAGQIFSYAIVVDNIAETFAEVTPYKILVHIPRKQAIEWIDTNEVGIYVTNKLPGGKTLDIIIEKDFPCKDRPGEDKSDTFTELADKKAPNC